MATQNAINLSAAGVVSYNGSGTFSGSTFSQYYALVGGASNAIVGVNPGSTVGIPMVSGGVSANPSFSTAVVAGGGTGVTSFTAYSVVCAGTTGTGALQNVSGVGTSGQVLTSNGASALPSWQAVSSNNFPFTVVTGATQTTAVNNGYIANAASGGVTFTLPSTAAVGTVIYITGLSGGSGWTLSQNALQSVQIGASITTVGTGGSLASTVNTDSLHLICAVANTTWICVASMGNITVV